MKRTSEVHLINPSKFIVNSIFYSAEATTRLSIEVISKGSYFKRKIYFVWY